MPLLALILALTPVVLAEAPVAATTAAPAAEPLLDALDLPQTAEALRQDGLPPEDVRMALDAARAKKMSAAAAAQTMRDSHDAVRHHGVPPGMGPFVRAQIEAGLSGKELAEAIRKECEARGIPRQPPMGDKPPGGQMGDGQGMHPGDKPPGGQMGDGQGMRHGDKPPGGQMGDGQGTRPDGKAPPRQPPPGKDGKTPPSAK